ncbi:Transcription factor zip1 [Smittium culicis]|uniref:Transcription factor zip1 n=1 Tax=Smittium culicis TaxID=133412 RepID=A0A1R1X392_9FUNG|nr:Transcription factor zip1 [Smittium culicis]
MNHNSENNTLESIKAIQGYLDSGFISANDLQNELEFWSKASIISDNNSASNDEPQSVKISNPFVFNAKKQKTFDSSNNHPTPKISTQNQHDSQGRAAINQILEMSQKQSNKSNEFSNQYYYQNTSDSPNTQNIPSAQNSENYNTAANNNNNMGNLANSESNNILSSILSEQFLSGLAKDSLFTSSDSMPINALNMMNKPAHVSNQQAYFRVNESNVSAQDQNQSNLSNFVESFNTTISKKSDDSSISESGKYSRSTIENFLRIKEAASRLMSEINNGQQISSQQKEDSESFKLPNRDTSHGSSIQKDLGSKRLSDELESASKRAKSNSSYNSNDSQLISNASEDTLNGDRRKVTSEEDKRRRNTAASARFRVKKKLKEQMLEQRNLEMSQRLQEMEKKVKKVTMENRWLKSIVVEKEPNSLITKGCPCHHPNGFSSTECNVNDNEVSDDFDL